jgi:hypothetical protein
MMVNKTSSTIGLIHFFQSNCFEELNKIRENEEKDYINIVSQILRKFVKNEKVLFVDYEVFYKR